MDEFLHIAEHVLEHSVSDTLYLIPFLFVTYLAMEWLEHKTGAKTQKAIRHAGAAGPVVGAFLGVVPQCGFSAMAATLYAGRVITLGTLFAVLLSTSDEMLPIFLAENVAPNTILSIMGAKVIIGMVMGFVVDAGLRLMRRDKDKLRIHELCAQDKCGCDDDCVTCKQNPELVYSHFDDGVAATKPLSATIAAELEETEGPIARHEAHEETGCAHHCECGHSHEAHDDHGHSHDDAHDQNGPHGPAFAADSAHNDTSAGAACCHHDHSHDGGWKGIVKSALKHTLTVTVFIFLVTIVLNALLEVVGEDVLAQFLGASPMLAVLASALVGLIPNCAASVVIAQLYLEGVLGPGAMLAGLLTAAGVGLLVLVRSNRPAVQNVKIVVALYATGVFWGLVANGLGVVF